MEETRFCRLCLTTSAVYYPLLKDNGKEMVYTLTGIEINSDYSYSTESCVKCWLDLKLAYKIQQHFLEAEKKFQLVGLHGIESNMSNSESDLLKEESSEDVIQTNQSFFKDDNTDFSDPDNDKDYPEIILIHTEEASDPLPPSICPICGLTCQDDSTLYPHINTHYCDKQYCEDCTITLPNISSYRDHLETKHPGVLKKTFTCGICQLSFKYQPLYGVHMTSVHPAAKTGKRKIATEKFDLDGNNLQCNECNKILPNKNSFKLHVKGHKRKPCPICGRQITVYNLSKHISLHKSGPSICHLCGITSKNFESLRGHMYYTHSQKKLTCEECGKEFKKLYTYKMHIKKEHTGEKTFTCDTCGKRFFTNYYLNTHIRTTHLKQRPYICQFCNRGFSSRFAMRTHERQHTNEAPYVCEICGEGFRQNVSLRAHRKSKHNIIEKKKTECKICGKMFVNDWAVKSHIRSVHD